MTGHHWLSKGAPGQSGDHGCSKPERLGGVWPGPEERGVRSEGSEQGRLRPKPQRAAIFSAGSRKQMEPQCPQELCVCRLPKYSFCAILLGL